MRSIDFDDQADRDQRPSDWPCFQILALDGGGFRGIHSAAVLAAIEQDLGRPILSYFDLVVGTSTGGLIALGLGAGLSPREIVDFYVEWGPKIFRRQHLGLLRPRYGSDALRLGLRQVLGDRTMSDSSCRLVVPAYDLTADRVYVFKTPHHPRLRRDWQAPMVDVGMATAAAPVFFPAHRFGSVQLIDGGVWANSPGALGIAEAISLLGVPLSAIRLFSVGTTSDVAHRHARLYRGGIVQWLRGMAVIDVLMHGQARGADGMAQHFLGPERYLRHDPVVPAGVLKMDRCDTDELVGLAQSHSRALIPFFDQIFGGHRAPEFHPLHPAAQGALA